MSGMRTLSPPRQEDDVLTPRTGTVLRRALFWIAIVVALLIVAVIVMASTRSESDGIVLDGSDPAPTGGQALLEVLRAQGVDVIETTTIDATREAASGAEEPTIFVHDDEGILDESRIAQAAELASRLVVAEPDAYVLDELAPEVAIVGETAGAAEADCRVPAAEAAQEIRTDGTAYELLGDDLDAELCFTGDEGASLVQFDRDGTVVTVLGATGALSNAEIDERGDAALALQLLGAADTLIWYLPDAGDLDDPQVTTAELLPGWLSPVAILLALTGLAAVAWKGRRFGPLVIENLPVVVPARETMEGRARLYARGSARLHALDSLRIGTVARLATACGLPRVSTVTDVVDAVAAATGRPRTEIAGLLVDADPQTDADLVRLSDALLDLEGEVGRATRPGVDGSRPPASRPSPTGESSPPSSERMDP